MRFNPAAFDSWLGNVGQQFLWRASYACPCVNPTSGAAKPNCPQCHGKGRIWAANPTACVAGMASQKTQREWANFGVWQSGDAVVTIPQASPMYAMGQFDRAIMVNATEVFSLVLTRGGQIEKVFLPVDTVTRLFWLDANSNIVDGSLPTVNADGTLTWAAGATQPPVGTQYTIQGTAFQEYFCFGEFPGNRNEHQGMRLPKRVVLRKFDLFGR